VSAGSEQAARDFYVGLLGRSERPPALAGRGGCWFAGHGIELHLGENGFRLARKAHPGLLWPDLDQLAGRLAGASYQVAWAEDELPGFRRFYAEDGHGNRLEFLAPYSVVRSHTACPLGPTQRSRHAVCNRLGATGAVTTL
jgi:hypothetical protein